METEFTPLLSLFGGSIIGFAIVLSMLLLGRIAGVTGIVQGLIFPQSIQDFSWRLVIILGMITSPIAFIFITGQNIAINFPNTNTMILLGGMIVGVGVTLGNGCTSGHGVCGMARLSSRSIAATITFMIFAIITVYLIRHVVGA